MRFIEYSKVSKTVATIWRRSIFAIVLFIGYLMAAQLIRTLEVGALVSAALIAPVWAAEMFFCVMIHELGHAGAASLVGWRIHVIAIGPLSYFPIERRFARTWAVKGRGGFVLALPGISNSDERGRTIFTLGGPAANLVFGAIGLSFALALQAKTWNHRDTLTLLAGSLSVDSLAVGFANLIPFWTASRPSDGARLLNHLFGESTAGTRRNLVWISAQAAHGVSPAYWDADRIRALWDYEDPENENGLRDRLLLSHYLALGDVEHAVAVTERHMRTAKSKSPSITLEHAFLIAFVENRGEEAKRILDGVPEDARGSFHYWRALAVAKARLGATSDAQVAVKNASALVAQDRARPDQDDHAIFSAIEKGFPLPNLTSRVAPA